MIPINCKDDNKLLFKWILLNQIIKAYFIRNSQMFTILEK